MSMRWGRVTAVSPVRIRLDGETVPLDITPQSLAPDLAVGDVVRCELESGRQLIVYGRLQT